MILNPENICPVCHVEHKTARKRTCVKCCDSSPLTPPGRPVVYTDEQILDAIEQGADTPDKLLEVLGLKHKTNILRRLRIMRDAGLVSIVENNPPQPFTITSERWDH